MSPDETDPTDPDDTPVADLTVGELLDRVASREVTPSGGTIAAVGGAAGAALCEMACIHTLEASEGGGDVALRDAGEDLATRRADLLALAEEDLAAVEALQTAFDAADSTQSDAVQRAAERATEVPLETAALCCEVLDGAVVATDAAAQNTVPDAGTGASLAQAGLRACVWTARSNLPLLEDEAFVADARERAKDLETVGQNLIEDVAANLRQTW